MFYCTVIHKITRGNVFSKNFFSIPTQLFVSWLQTGSGSEQSPFVTHTREQKTFHAFFIACTCLSGVKVVIKIILKGISWSPGVIKGPVKLED